MGVHHTYIRAGDNAVLGSSCRPDCIFMCRDVNMGEEDMRRFWEAQKGKQIARKILNCRRNNAMNSMKAKFEGRWPCYVCLHTIR